MTPGPYSHLHPLPAWSVAGPCLRQYLPQSARQVAAGHSPQHLYLPPVALTLAAAALIHGALIALPGPDSLAIAIIKLRSIGGVAILALAVWHLLVRLGMAQPARGAALVMLLPSLAVNAALIGQNDIASVAACLVGLAAAVDRRHSAMLLWYGIALGLSAQALLIAPFFVALLLQRRVTVTIWSLALLAAAVIALPSQLLGWPPASPIGIDGNGFTDLTHAAPNIWSILDRLPRGDDIPLRGLAFTCAIGASAAFIARFSAQPVHGRALIAAALLAPLITAGLLPWMDERCFLIADIIALVLAIKSGDRASWVTALLVQAGSMLALLSHLSGIDSIAAVAAAPMIVATWRIAAPLINPAANDNPLLARTNLAKHPATGPASVLPLVLDS